MLRRVASVVCAFSLLLGCDAGKSSTDLPATVNTDNTPKGCAVDDAPQVAPGGYYTNGSTLCTADGVAHLFHGVDRPSMEWDPNGEGSGVGVGIPAEDFRAMASWHANVVRIALNQDFWLSGAALYSPAYEGTVDRTVRAAEAAGLDVILDLHWSDRGDPTVTKLSGQVAGASNQQPMADANSLQFWSEVAAKYQGDGHVIFELYNEPHDISWQVWLKGGTSFSYTIVGMQQLYDTVRSTGANNVVIAGGLSWAFDLSGVGASPIQGYNIMYASHPYKPQDAMERWEGAFGYLATADLAPVILTEFGDTASNCSGTWDSKLTQFADAHRISWTAWAWWPGNCSFPSLISDWAYTPTVQGQAVQAALLAYPYEPAGRMDLGQNSSGAGGEGGSNSGANAGGSSAGGTSAEGGVSSEGGTSAEGGASGGTQ